MTHYFTLLIATYTLLLNQYHTTPIQFFTTSYPSPCLQSPHINEISIHFIPIQLLLDTPLQPPLQSDNQPQQRLFHPLQHQQGIWTKDRLQKFYLLYPSRTTPFSTSSQTSSTINFNPDDSYHHPSITTKR